MSIVFSSHSLVRCMSFSSHLYNAMYPVLQEVDMTSTDAVGGQVLTLTLRYEIMLWPGHGNINQISIRTTSYKIRTTYSTYSLLAHSVILLTTKQQDYFIQLLYVLKALSKTYFANDSVLLDNKVLCVWWWWKQGVTAKLIYYYF